jgi:hypothetical protein
LSSISPQNVLSIPSLSFSITQTYISSSIIFLSRYCPFPSPQNSSFCSTFPPPPSHNNSQSIPHQ